MLLPFTRRILSIPEIVNRYVPTVLADVVRENANFCGSLLMHQAASSTVALIERGKILSGAFYSPESGLVLHSCNCKALMDSFEETLAVEVLECDESCFGLNLAFLTHRPSAVLHPAAGAFETARHLPVSGPAILARMSGPLAELSLWNDGQFVCAYVFDEELKHHIGCDETTWSNGSKPEHSYWLTCGATAKTSAPQMDEFEDPLMLMVEKYFVVFNHMQEIMDCLYGENTLHDLNQLLERYKQKYPPLYRGLYINPETHQINWERMTDNRTRVDVKFRYDRFQLYLDEILLDFVKLLYERTRVEGVRQLRELIVKLKEYSPDRDSETSSRFFRKLEKVLRV